MTDQPDEQPSAMPSKYDPFQELRTMPGGWDLSSILKPLPVTLKPGFLAGQLDAGQPNAEEDNAPSPKREDLA
jgi:hypothetical protein